MASRLLALGRALRAPTPTPASALRGFCSKGSSPSPRTEPTIAQAILRAFEDFVSFLKRKPDWEKASELADELFLVLKQEPQDVEKARMLITQLSKVVGATTHETRLEKVEDNVRAAQRVGFGIATLFAAYLMTIPAAIYVNKYDTDNQITNVNGRIDSLQSTCSSTTPAPKLNIDARVSHEVSFKQEGTNPEEA